MRSKLFFPVLVATFLFSATHAFAATVQERVPEAFKQVFGRIPTTAEKAYWVGRVTSGDKKTFEQLRGAMYHQKANGTAAIPSKKTAAENKQELTKAVLSEFIAIFGNNPTNSEKAWWRKRIACDEIKNLKSLRASMSFHKAKKVRKGSDSICGAAASTASGESGSGIIRRSIAGISNHIMGNEVRIGIHKTDGRAIHVTADGQFQVREGKSKIAATVGKEDVVQVSWSNGKYHVRGSGLEIDTENEIRLVPLNQAIMQIKSYSDPSVTYPGKNYNRFRGTIEIRKCDDCKELWAINELRVEHYLRGLGETSGTGPEEYLKALGVAARTYLVYHRIITGGRFPKKGFDIDNTPNDQIYRGYEFEIIAPRFVEAVNKTKGVIVANGEGDKPVVTVYFSDSDGRTRSAKEAWNSSRFPHLESVEDPHHAASKCVGHCVGMSAQGAYGLAGKDGWSFQKILKYFYKGIKLVKAY